MLLKGDLNLKNGENDIETNAKTGRFSSDKEWMSMDETM